MGETERLHLLPQGPPSLVGEGRPTSRPLLLISFILTPSPRWGLSQHSPYIRHYSGSFSVWPQLVMNKENNNHL